jgi:hypothetical protein
MKLGAFEQGRISTCHDGSRTGMNGRLESILDDQIQTHQMSYSNKDYVYGCFSVVGYEKGNGVAEI